MKKRIGAGKICFYQIFSLFINLFICERGGAGIALSAAH
jgi:hypothetical protein